ERIVLELKDKLKDLTPAVIAGAPTPVAEDVLSALINLGYGRPAAQKGVETAITRNPELAKDFETLFRSAMAAMQ
ncbi:MAG: Holliday junction branch migration protein RuvA, partial [Acidobacteriaceae bacterium]